MTIQIRNCPLELHQEARRQAFEAGISLNAWLIDAIRLKCTATRVDPAALVAPQPAPATCNHGKFLKYCPTCKAQEERQ